MEKLKHWPHPSNANPNQVCKLVKSIYGLKQASRIWHERIYTFLIANHYKQATLDHFLFVKSKTSSITFLLVYVDDVILRVNYFDEFNSIKAKLDRTF